MRHTFTLLVLSCLAAPSVGQAIERQEIATGLRLPNTIGSPPEDFERIFIGEAGGTVRIVKGGALLATPFLTLPRARQDQHHFGLTDLAFHPDFPNNGFVFVYYTLVPVGTAWGDAIIERYRVSSTNPDVADPQSRTLIYGPIPNPFAGDLEFGTDGFLYIGTADNAGRCWTQDGAQLLGKILRLDVDQNPNGPGVPAAGNPFVGDPNFRDEIWSYGLRVPTLSIDRQTGDLWIVDRGWQFMDEINAQPAASTGGENWGWPIMDGTRCSTLQNYCNNPPPCNSPRFSSPVFTRPTRGPYWSGFGSGRVYRGCAIPSLRGAYFFNDVSAIFSFVLVNGRVTNLQNWTAALREGSQDIRAFGEDASGELLYVRGTNAYRIRPDGRMQSTQVGAGSRGSHGKVPIHDICGRFGDGHRVTLRVRDGLPNAGMAIVFSRTLNPIRLPFPGFGTLYPSRIDFSVPLVTDARGNASLELPGDGFAPIQLIHQAAIFDVGLLGVTLSNGLATYFFRMGQPFIYNVRPRIARPGTVVTILGDHFESVTTLSVGGVSVPIQSVERQRITFLAPANVACDAGLELRNPTQPPTRHPFNPSPFAQSVTPSSGAAQGGTTIDIQGFAFAPPTTVTIGGNPAQVLSSSATSVVVVTPPGTPGPATVVITSRVGCQGTTTFTYF